MTTTDTLSADTAGHPGWASRPVGGSVLWVPGARPDSAETDAPVEPVSAGQPDTPKRTRFWTPWPTHIRAAVVGTCSVLAACWTVSFDAIVVGAQAASIPNPFALLCPVIVDGEMAIGTLALVSIARRVGWWTRVYLGSLILASVGVSMAANMAGPFTRTHLLPAPWSYLAAGVPSLWIALIVHQLVILWRHWDASERVGQPVSVDTPAEVPIQPAPASNYGVRSADGQWWWDGHQWRPVTPPEVVIGESDGQPGAVSVDAPGPAATRRPPAPSDARVDRLADVLRETHGQVSVKALGARTSIPRTTVGRLLAQAIEVSGVDIPDGHPLATFRPAPGGTGQDGVAA